MRRVDTMEKDSSQGARDKVRETTLVLAALVLVVLGLACYHVLRPDDFGANDYHSLRGLGSSLGAEQITRPVLGVFTQSGQGEEYIAASYVKYAEAVGARVVPIRYWWSEEKLVEVFKGIHGVLMPGGDAPIEPGSKLHTAASIMLREAERSNSAGKHFPIWGTCLGWELLAVLSANSYDILSKSGKFQHQGSGKIYNVNRTSKMFRGLSPSLYWDTLRMQKMFYYSHQMGVTPEVFHNLLDTDCWKITALGHDRLGKPFVAAAENVCRPYFGVQFHPEKSLFEWHTKTDIPHALNAQDMTRHFIRFLRLELGTARPISQSESWVFENSIYKVGTLVDKGDYYFNQMYIFKGAPSSDVADHHENISRP